MSHNGRQVTRSLVLALALLLGTLAVSDRFVCPDGCTEEASASFDCVLCHGFAFTVAALPAMPSDVIARTCPLVPVIPPPPAPQTIEHPPRA